MNIDPEGFLLNFRDWNRDLAYQIAADNQIELADEHWEIIELAQAFFQEFDYAPSQRPLANFIKQGLGKDKASSIYLMKLFGASPAKMVARLGGLPKPKNCL
ncbi:TusE/DsrC/DsvC family sulfur relay protein [Gynuella sp.]|uniref:TusE/DsrC/DsvC family sulfur relay protein n=1 Tax=Gynuella sp. TaxID=2969146 RepID=UPI003D0BC284